MSPAKESDAHVGNPLILKLRRWVFNLIPVEAETQSAMSTLVR